MHFRRLRLSTDALGPSEEKSIDLQVVHRHGHWNENEPNSSEGLRQVHRPARWQSTLVYGPQTYQFDIFVRSWLQQ